ncbi:MAG: glutaredoxin domain-containing protein [Candidatus Dormibacteria bacterium]
MTVPQPAPVRVLATNWCVDCMRARRAIKKSGVPYEWINIDQDLAAEEEVLRINHGMRSVPTIIFADGAVLVEPSGRALRGKLAELAPAAASSGVTGAACETDDVPGCDTGPGDRFKFVARELIGIFRSRGASRRRPKGRSEDPGPRPSPRR